MLRLRGMGSRVATAAPESALGTDAMSLTVPTRNRLGARPLEHAGAGRGWRSHDVDRCGGGHQRPDRSFENMQSTKSPDLATLVGVLVLAGEEAPDSSNTAHSWSGGSGCDDWFLGNIENPCLVTSLLSSSLSGVASAAPKREGSV